MNSENDEGKLVCSFELLANLLASSEHSWIHTYSRMFLSVIIAHLLPQCHLHFPTSLITAEINVKKCKPGWTGPLCSKKIDGKFCRPGFCSVIEMGTAHCLPSRIISSGRLISPVLCQFVEDQRGWWSFVLIVCKRCC